MRGLSALCSLLLAAGLCVSVFSDACIDAHATDIVYRQLSVADSYAFYGDTISFMYYSQTGYKNATLTKQRDSLSYVRAGSEMVGSNIPTWVSSTTLQYCLYEAQVTDYSFDPQYLGVNITPNVNFSDCNGLRFCAAAYIGNSTTVSSSAYDASFISIYGQNDLRYENSLYTDNGIFPYWRIGRTTSSTGNRVIPIWCDYTSDTLSTVNLLRIGFNGARLNNGYISIYLSCPLVNDNAVSGTGIVTGTQTTVTGTGDITVNVDMQETNGILDRILQAISGIVDAIAGLFVPDSDFLDVWCDNMQELLENHLGGAYDAIGMLVDLIESLYHPSSVGSISCPTVSLPGGLTLGGWTLNLQVQGTGFTVLYTGLAWIIDFLVTMAFLKTCRKKVEIFLNPDSEVVSNDN